MAGWRFEHTYADLPQLFHTPATPTPVRDPALVALNRPLAATLGLDLEMTRAVRDRLVFVDTPAVAR